MIGCKNFSAATSSGRSLPQAAPPPARQPGARVPPCAGREYKNLAFPSPSFDWSFCLEATTQPYVLYPPNRRSALLFFLCPHSNHVTPLFIDDNFPPHRRRRPFYLSTSSRVKPSEGIADTPSDGVRDRWSTKCRRRPPPKTRDPSLRELEHVPSHVVALHPANDSVDYDKRQTRNHLVAVAIAVVALRSPPPIEQVV